MDSHQNVVDEEKKSENQQNALLSTHQWWQRLCVQCRWVSKFYNLYPSFLWPFLGTCNLIILPRPLRCLLVSRYQHRYCCSRTDCLLSFFSLFFKSLSISLPHSSEWVNSVLIWISKNSRNIDDPLLVVGNFYVDDVFNSVNHKILACFWCYGLLRMFLNLRREGKKKMKNKLTDLLTRNRKTNENIIHLKYIRYQRV